MTVVSTFALELCFPCSLLKGKHLCKSTFLSIYSLQVNPGGFPFSKFASESACISNCFSPTGLIFEATAGSRP